MNDALGASCSPRTAAAFWIFFPATASTMWGTIHPAMFGQIMVMRMFREKQILTQICGNNFMVLKAAPPLIVTAEQLDEFVQAIRGLVELAEMSRAFWTEALGMPRRAVNV
jgi:ornithine--oxo-acid transaminase